MARRTSSTKKNQKALKKKIVITLLALVFVVIGGFLLWRYFHPAKATTDLQNEPQDVTTINVPTQSANTEGKTIQVPTNVDPSSIKNYELITENEDFKIRKLDNQYVITLYPIINHPDADSYTSQLKQFKQEALNYLSKSGLNTNTLSITYDPAEAAQL